MEKLYSSKGFSSEFLIFKEFFDTTLASYSNQIELYTNILKRLSNDLLARKLEIPKKLIIAWALNHLTPEYDNFVSNITQSLRLEIDQNRLNLESLFSNLIDESRRLSYKDTESS